MHQIADQRVDRRDRVRPRTADVAQRRSLIELPRLTDHLADPFELAHQPLIEIEHFVERIGDLPGEPFFAEIEPNGKIAFFEGVEGREKLSSV